jgi:phospholipase/lecithinase/hemolysin
LIARRRSLVASLQNATPEQLSGESIAQIQSAIDALNRAIEEQLRQSSGDAARRTVPAS